MNFSFADKLELGGVPERVVGPGGFELFERVEVLAFVAVVSF